MPLPQTTISVEELGELILQLTSALDSSECCLCQVNRGNTKFLHCFIQLISLDTVVCCLKVNKNRKSLNVKFVCLLNNLS